MAQQPYFHPLTGAFVPNPFNLNPPFTSSPNPNYPPNYPPSPSSSSHRNHYQPRSPPPRESLITKADKLGEKVILQPLQRLLNAPPRSSPDPPRSGTRGRLVFPVMPDSHYQPPKPAPVMRNWAYADQDRDWAVKYRRELMRVRWKDAEGLKKQEERKGGWVWANNARGKEIGRKIERRGEERKHRRDWEKEGVWRGYI